MQNSKRRGRGSQAHVKAAPADNLHRRLWVLYFFLGAISILVCYRLYVLQAIEHAAWRKRAERQQRTSVVVHAPRAPVFDRFGRTLATTIDAASIGVHPHKLKDRNLVATRLAGLLGVRKSQLVQKVASRKTFNWIAKGVPATLGKEVSKLGLRGVRVIREFQRSYPQGVVAGSLLGRVGRDGDGLSGVEFAFNAVLGGEQERVQTRRDARGRLLKVGFSGAEDMPQHKSAEQGLTLSIDTVIQRIVEEELERGKQESGAAKAFGIVLDANTGELLAMGSKPGYDPNIRSTKSAAQLRNPLIQDNFEPGSTLKPIVAAAALQSGVVRGRSMMDCEEGKYRVGRHTIRDVHKIGKVSFADAVVQSSNVCLAKIGMKLGRKSLAKGLSDFGFGKKTGLELAGESPGIFRASSSWKEIDLATHSFGHGIAVVATQLVRAYAAFANGGYLPELTIRKREGEAPLQKVLDANVVNTVNKMLHRVTSDEIGTGRLAAIRGLKVYGKTGTAHKLVNTGRGYDPDKVLASFIGFIRGEDAGIERNLVMLVIVDEPTVKPRWGGRVAGPVFRRAMSRILSYMMMVEPGELRTAKLKSNSRIG